MKHIVFALICLSVSCKAICGAGGFTFDFTEISKRRFPSGTGAVVAPSDWKSGYCYLHNRDVASDDPRRVAVKKAVRWEIEGDELVIVKDPKLLEICRDEALARNVSGGYSHTLRFPDASGGVYRVSLTYRMRHDVGSHGYVLATPIRAKGLIAKGVSAPGDSDTNLKAFELSDIWSEYVMWTQEVRVPAGCDSLNLVVRIDGVGELRFKDVRVTRVAFENLITLKALPADFFDGTFAFPSGQCGLPAWLWKKNDPNEKYDPESFTFVLTLPKGYTFVDSTMGKPGETRMRLLSDGSTECRIPATRTYSGSWVLATYNGWPVLNALVRAAADAPRGTMRLYAEYKGVRVSDVSETTVFTIPALRADVPKRYVNGFYLGGPYAAFQNDAGREGFAEMFTAAGARWVVQMRPDDATRAVWRRRGVKYITPEASGLASNGFRVGDTKNRPADERYVALPGGRMDYLSLATCPIAVYTESDYFRNDTLPKLKALLYGCDGFWGNWEPYMFAGRGCMCEKCRAAFARFVGVSDEDMARDWPQELAFGRKWHEKVLRFRSLEHAKLVKTIDKYVREYTGGSDSLGFIPGVAWCEMASSWRPNNIAAEVQPFDYAGSLKWIDPWGPYPWWDASTPYVPTGYGDLGYFLVAKDVREQVDRDYGSAAPKLMSFPHGVQLGTCLAQPESIAIALDAFFFNRWESSIVYAFPKGYDARYWQAFAEATTRAARYEDIVWDGERCDERVTLERDASAPYPPNAKAVYAQYLPTARNVPLLQHVAYKKDGRLIVAVFNFADRDPAVFRMRFNAQCDMTLDGRRVSAADLRVGVPLTVPAARCRVFEFNCTERR